METINQATTVVKNSLWGEGANRTGQHHEVHKSMIDDSVTRTEYNGRLESDPDAEDAYQPDRDQNRAVPQGPQATGGVPQGSNVTGEQQNTNKNPFSNSNEPNTGFGGAGAQPSVGADPSSGQQINPKSQGSSRPGEAPEDSPTFSGETGSSNSGASGASNGGPGGMKLPDSENKSKGEGTGTLYEKSTGLHVDGGDFDATRPGAAREAARLMDEKGINHGIESGGQQQEEEKKEKKWYGVDHSGFGGHGSHQNKRPSVSSASGRDTEQPDYDVDSNDTTQKKGLAQKIKDKLHHSSE